MKTSNPSESSKNAKKKKHEKNFIQKCIRNITQNGGGAHGETSCKHKKAYSRDPSTLSLRRAALPCLHTHKQKNKESPAASGERPAASGGGQCVFTEAGIERWWGKWQSHWSLGVCWSAGEFSLPRSHFTAECSLESLMETSRNLHRKFWTQRRMCSPGSSTCGRC